MEWVPEGGIRSNRGRISPGEIQVKEIWLCAHQIIDPVIGMCLCFAILVQVCLSLVKVYEWTRVVLYFYFQLLALLHKSGACAKGFTRAAQYTMYSWLRAFLDVHVLPINPFSRTGNVSRAYNVASRVSANIVIHQSSPRKDTSTSQIFRCEARLEFLILWNI